MAFEIVRFSGPLDPTLDPRLGLLRFALAEQPLRAWGSVVRFLKARLHFERLGKWVRYSVVGPEAGYAILIIEDATREIEALQAWKRAANRYQELFEYAPIGYHEIDVRGIIRRINRTELELLGYRRRELLHKPVWTMVAQGEGEKRLRRDLRADKPVRSTYEVTFVAKDGTMIPVMAHNVSILDRNGNVIGLRTAVEDLRERKALERRLIGAQRLEAIGRLAAGVAHDFNNVLTAISGYSQLISSSIPKGDAIQEDIEQIRMAVDRASRLTRQLLTFAKRQPAAPIVLDVNQSIKDMEKLVRKLLREDIELRLALSTEAGRVEMDPSQFEQIVMNLVVNARDAMPHGGHLEIRTACVELHEPLSTAVGELKEGSYVVLSVSDTGVGMDEKTISNIFEPFFTTKGESGGTGLGLATVYGIVTGMGGSINVDSHVGKGTRFEIFLPRTIKEPAGAGEREGKPLAKAGAGELILVVDDDSLIRNLLARFLRERGFQVLLAEDGERALELFAQNQSDIALVVTDVVMPRLDGIELNSKLKELKPDIPVIFMSGYLDAEKVEAVVGGDAFSWKPFSPADLVRKVIQTLEKHKGS